MYKIFLDFILFKIFTILVIGKCSKILLKVIKLYFFGILKLFIYFFIVFNPILPKKSQAFLSYSRQSILYPFSFIE